MKIWLGGNDGGTLLDEGSALVSVLDHGLTVGDGVFETLKARHAEVFAVTRHLERLARSARAMGLPAPDLDVARAAIAQTAAANDEHPLARVRVTYTGGPAPLGSERGTYGPTLVVAVGPGRARPDATRVITVPWTRNERSATAGVKSTSYADNVVALARAAESGASEALFADTRGRLSEGTGSNVFLVVGGRILTPTLAAGCLAGITRGLVIEWVREAAAQAQAQGSGAATDVVAAGESGLLLAPVAETDIAFEALGTADEIFLTSSLRDVQAVTELDGRAVGSGAIGPVTRLVQRIFAERSAADPDPLPVREAGAEAEVSSAAVPGAEAEASSGAGAGSEAAARA